MASGPRPAKAVKILGSSRSTQWANEVRMPTVGMGTALSCPHKMNVYGISTTFGKTSIGGFSC